MISPPLSLIVPCGPQDDAAPRIISSEAKLPGHWERIASVGTDQQPPLPAGWQVRRGEFGRGRQLNRAARRARGEWLWFMHADSAPDDQAIDGVERFIAAPTSDRDGSRIGYSRLSFDSDGPPQTALNSVGANWRSRWLKLPYGDQGLCLLKSDFDALGGFREDLVRGEDLDFIVRARSAGMRVMAMGGTVSTSARRYRQRGWLRTTIHHQLAAIRLIRDAKRGGSP